jgi:P4 family phage/plasmid primase-like protien
MALCKRRLANALRKAEGDTENDYVQYCKKLCSGGKIQTVMTLAVGGFKVKEEILDANPFDLNTPAGIVDLKTGKCRPHDPKAYCSRMTAVSPGTNGRTGFQDFMDFVTCGDPEFHAFLRALAGAMAIGKVYNEALVIAHGGGANGKSTLFNTLAKILGDYAGKIPAEALTTKAQSVKADLAELEGLRFVLAGETEQGQRLSSKMLKTIASTDAILGERKYYDPHSFEPVHQTVLYTNHLPRLGSLDHGTKRRIILAPFRAQVKVRDATLADKLFAESGGRILSWLIEGAKLYIKNGYEFPPCEVVKAAKNEYIAENDWARQFLDECCAQNSTVQSSTLFQVYLHWCEENGIHYKLNKIDFAHGLEEKNYERRKSHGIITGCELSLNERNTTF